MQLGIFDYMLTASWCVLILWCLSKTWHISEISHKTRTPDPQLVPISAALLMPAGKFFCPTPLHL